jgi:hypothetical protein
MEKNVSNKIPFMQMEDKEGKYLLTFSIKILKRYAKKSGRKLAGDRK